MGFSASTQFSQTVREPDDYSQRLWIVAEPPDQASIRELVGLINRYRLDARAAHQSRT